MHSIDFQFGPLAAALRHSLSGLAIAWRGERAFRQECLVLAALVVALALTGAAFSRWLLVLGLWCGTMIVELLNSAIEKTCDLVTTEFRPLIKAAKDMASAAILLSMLINVAVWSWVFFLGR